MLFKQIICGGTFDRLHEGHKEFLRFAFLMGQHVLIGLTSDVFIKKMQKKNVLPYAKRKENLESFLKAENLSKRTTITKIENKLDETQISTNQGIALLVSYETYSVGLEINKKRKKNGLDPLDLLVFPLFPSVVAEKISSSDIREGTINSKGMLIPEKFLTSKTLKLSQKLRQTLQEPYGELFEKEVPPQYLAFPEKIAVVGDVATKRLHAMGILQQLSVVDFHIERKPTHESLSELGFNGTERIVKIVSPQGKIAKEVWKIFENTLENLEKQKTVIIVDGEDDLLVIPLILFLPLGYFLFYGQPTLPSSNQDKAKKGIVLVQITETIKRKTYHLLKQFE